MEPPRFFAIGPLILVERPEGKRLLGRHRSRGKANIKMDSKEIKCEGVIWINLVQDWRPVAIVCECNRSN
jgi:hypothetical protein